MGGSPPSLEHFITKESWLVFELLKHDQGQVKWMLYPPENWHVDPDFLEFKQFVKEIAIVNDAGERAVKAAEEIVNQVKDEKKMQKMLIVKSKLKKPSARTKEAAEQLTPAQQLDLAFKLGDPDQEGGEEHEVYSGSEIEEGSSLDFIDEEEVEQALLNENELILENEYFFS